MLYSKSLLFIYLDIWYCASVNTMLLLLSHFSHVQLLLPLNPSSPFPLKNLPAMQETLVLSLGGEDPLEKGMASHSSILAWRIPWTEELAGYSLWGHKELDITEQLLISLASTFGYHKFVFYVWVCFVSKFIFIIFLDSTCKWYNICLWHTSLSMIISRCIYVAANIIISFIFMTE